MPIGQRSFARKNRNYNAKNVDDYGYDCNCSFNCVDLRMLYLKKERLEGRREEPLPLSLPSLITFCAVLYFNLKCAIIYEPSGVLNFTSQQVPGCFNVCQLKMYCPDVESYLSELPPVA